MRVQQDVLLACMLNSLIHCTTNSEVGFQQSSVHTQVSVNVLLVFVVCTVIYNYMCVCMLQIACSLAREVLCGCVWCSTVRAAPLHARLNTCSTCTTHTSAACHGDTCTLTLSSWSSSSMWDTVPFDSWPFTSCTARWSIHAWTRGACSFETSVLGSQLLLLARHPVIIVSTPCS